MRAPGRALLILLLAGGLGVGVAYYVAGRQAGPAVEIASPERALGQRGSLAIVVDAPAGAVTRVEAVLEQSGTATPIFTFGDGGDAGAEITQQGDRLRIVHPIGQEQVPSLANGPATLRVTAARPVFFGLRQAGTTVTRDLVVRLDPPRVAVVSLHHHINHGGAEFVVYRVSPPDVTSGVRVADQTFPGFPASAVGLDDPSLHVAFFALSHEQDLNAPIVVFARDVADNEAVTPLDRRAFARPFARSRITIDDRFLSRIVPAIAATTPDLDIPTGSREALLEGFLLINGELRRRNNEAIAALAARTHPEMLWTEAFSQLRDTAVQSRFADYRTYLYDGREIDQQVHLGFDLASVAQAPVHAANRGVVVFAGDLGIYGNTVVLDHGLGVQSLYAHLSSIAVEPLERVEKGHVLGRTGITGLAGGDHLHFTMLVNGVAVNPVEWWDRQWMEDRVFRKIREAGGVR